MFLVYVFIKKETGYLDEFAACVTNRSQLQRPSAGGEGVDQSRRRRPVLAGICGPMQVAGSKVEATV